MSPGHWAVLLSYPVAVGAGQVLLKVASQRVSLAEGLIAKATEPVLLAALVLYGLLAIGWVLILRAVPLNTAYPFVALSFVVTPVLGATILGERLNITYGLGLALICAGVALTQRAMHVG